MLYTSNPTDRSPTQAVAVIVLAIATPILALLLLLFVLASRKRSRKGRDGGELGFSQVGNSQVISSPPKMYMPYPVASDMGKLPMTMEDRAGVSLAYPSEPQVTNSKNKGAPIGQLPSLEITPPSRPHSVAFERQTPRTPRTPGIQRVIPPPTPFGEVSDQPLSANSLDRMITKMETELREDTR